MHIDKKVYKINTNKDVDFKIVQISDIHFSLNYNMKRLDNIKKNIFDINPDFVCIIGDLIDEYDSSIIDVFTTWLKDLSSSFKVIIVLGNHDYITKYDGKYILHDDVAWINNIRSDNLIVLDNDIYSINNINFIGCNLDFSYYYDHESVSFDVYNKSLSNLLSGVHEGYNILLVHTPSIIFENNNYKNLDGFDRVDLVLCGHTHGGLMPSFIPGNFGVISPTKKFFPKSVRGRISILSSNVIISSGIVKLSRKSGISFFNDIYGYNVNVINVKKNH